MAEALLSIAVERESGAFRNFVGDRGETGSSQPIDLSNKFIKQIAEHAMTQKKTYAGLDVHKETIALAGTSAARRSKHACPRPHSLILSS